MKEYKLIAEDFLKSKFFKEYIEKYNVIYVCVTGSCGISSTPDDLDIGLKIYENWEYDAKTSYFENYEYCENGETLLIDIAMSPYNRIFSNKNNYTAGVGKIFYNFQDRLLWFNPKFPKTQKLLMNEEFLYKCKIVSLYTLFDHLYPNLIDYINNKNNFRSIINKTEYMLYYEYCMFTEKPIDDRIMTSLKDNDKKQFYSKEIADIFTDIIDYICSHPVDTIKLYYDMIEEFKQTADEDYRGDGYETI